MLYLEWTKWQDKFHLLTASVCVEKRSIAAAVSGCVKEKLARSQNYWEAGLSYKKYLPPLKPRALLMLSDSPFISFRQA